MPVARERTLLPILPVQNAQIATTPLATTRDVLTTMLEEAPSSLLTTRDRATPHIHPKVDSGKDSVAGTVRASILVLQHRRSK